MLRGPVESRKVAGRTDDPPALLRDALANLANPQSSRNPQG